MPLSRLPILFALICCLPAALLAQSVDFSGASIVSLQPKDIRLQTAARILQEEIKKRTSIEAPVTGKQATAGKYSIILGTEKQIALLPAIYQEALTQLPNTQTDGYKVILTAGNRTALVIGHDERGTLYGVGYLLRKMELRKGQILLPLKTAVSSSPAYPIRGHQLGYRPKTNAYDAWTVAQFDQYIRELALFGANSIEILPPNTDDDFSNEHMKLPAINMIAEQSRIGKKYGLDVWMWYPSMGGNYTSPDSIQVQLTELERVLKALPKLDALFVPGGDPGDLEPALLFAWLEQAAGMLARYHPHAKIWVSPQVFRPTEKWFNAFYEEVNKAYPWFGGVVYGPWIKETIQQVRQKIRKNIPIRQYPDITHSLSCQYPVPDWDIAYAITLGRECYNPCPNDEKHIHNLFAGYAQGSISYSEGINDDVNKFVWSGQDWDPQTPVIETLRDYARLFIGPDYTESVAQSLIALENNFKGPLLANSGVSVTLLQWQEMEKKATPETRNNFRFQMGLMRAYFDAYLQRRLMYETELEQSAKDALTAASSTGSIAAMDQAKKILHKAIDYPVRADLRQRCISLADSLFRNIGSQLTVRKHGAMAGRGNFIDNIDLPLNNAAWLVSQLQSVEKISGEEGRISAIDQLLNRTNPGPGGRYDDLGSPGSAKRITRQKPWSEDPGGLESPLTDFGVFLKGDEWVDVLPVGFEGKPVPLTWMNQVTTLYNTPLIMHYDNLDPGGTYMVRVAYTGRFASGIKLVADEKYLIHDFIDTGRKPLYEFPVPPEALADGNIQFTFSCRPADRGTQVAEIWLIKKS